MSLNFGLTKIKDFEKVCYDGEKINPRTEALIFLTMAIRLGEISPKTKNEFIRRMHVFQDINGSILQGSDGPIPLTEEDVERHCGLHTNVRNEAPAKFKRAMEEAAYDKLVKRR